MDKVCLAITTFNRGHLLKHSLERLCNLTIPDEILVISDGCTDHTLQVVDSFKDRLPIRAIYNHSPELSICSFARNIALKNTTADIFITSEPELLFVTDVVKQMVTKHHAIPNTMLTVGTIYHQGQHGQINDQIIKSPALWLSMNKHLINTSKHNSIPANSHGYVKIQNWQAPFAALYRKEWLMVINGWCEGFPANYSFDDIDICTRLRIKLGIGQIIDHEMEAIHQYHGHPINKMGNATLINSDYFHNKNLSVNGYEDPNNPNLIANVGKEWGVIVPKPE